MSLLIAIACGSISGSSLPNLEYPYPGLSIAIRFAFLLSVVSSKYLFHADKELGEP